MTGKFFTARYRGQLVVIGPATMPELAALTKPVAKVACRDHLDQWTLVAIRDTARPVVAVHVLGWRTMLANTWITSSLTAVDPEKTAVATRSGHVYLLGDPDSTDLDPELRDHLAYALRTWGFADVQG